MSDIMTFPETVDEYMEQYKITDTKQIYTNGMELVPIFRMKQWFEHKPEQRWIPVSERLPEEPNIYTVTDSKGDVVRFAFYNNESSRKYWRRCAKAWMPLPEAWEGEEE